MPVYNVPCRDRSTFLRSIAPDRSAVRVWTAPNGTAPRVVIACRISEDERLFNAAGLIYRPACLIGARFPLGE